MGTPPWPAQKRACFRISMPSAGFRAIPSSHLPFSVPPIWDSEKTIFFLSSWLLSRPYSDRRKVALPAEPDCPSQKMAFSRASSGTSARSA